MQNAWPVIGQLIGLLIAIFLIAAVIATAGTPLATTVGTQPVIVATAVVAPAGQAATVVVQPATLPTPLPLPTAIIITAQSAAPAEQAASVVVQPAVLPTAIIIGGEGNSASRALVVESAPQANVAQGNDVVGHTTEPTCSYRIKAIVENNARRYYRPDDPNYFSKTVNASNGDRWFCDLSSVQNAGWRDAALP